MSQLPRRIIVSATIALALSLIGSWARAEQPIGRVSAFFGNVQIKGAAGVRKAAIAEAIYNNETVITGNTEAASVLLDSKVVVKLDANTEVKIVENRLSQKVAPDHLRDTHLELGKGTAEVFLGKRGLNEGAVALSDTIATIDATGTVFTASFAPDTREGTYFCEESKITVHPVVVGPATVVPANQLARVRDGKLLGIERLNRQELRSRTSGLQKLSTQSQQHSAKVSQQRNDAAVVRTALAAETKRQGASPKQAAQLSDLLLARCADLDNLAAKGRDAPGVDGTIIAQNGVVNIGVVDAQNVGDVISLQARSCTDANLQTFTSKVLKQTLDLFTVHVGAPNIIELNVNNLNPGDKANALAIIVSPAGVKATPANSSISTPFDMGGKQKTIRILVK